MADRETEVTILRNNQWLPTCRVCLWIILIFLYQCFYSSLYLDRSQLFMQVRHTRTGLFYIVYLYEISTVQSLFLIFIRYFYYIDKRIYRINKDSMRARIFHTIHGYLLRIVRPYMYFLTVLRRITYDSYDRYFFRNTTRQQRVWRVTVGCKCNLSLNIYLRKSNFVIVALEERWVSAVICRGSGVVFPVEHTHSSSAGWIHGVSLGLTRFYLAGNGWSLAHVILLRYWYWYNCPWVAYTIVNYA